MDDTTPKARPAAPVDKSKAIDDAVCAQLSDDLKTAPDAARSQTMDKSYGYDTPAKIEAFLKGVAAKLAVDGYVLDPTQLNYGDCSKASVADLEAKIAAKVGP